MLLPPPRALTNLRHQAQTATMARLTVVVEAAPMRRADHYTVEVGS
jgi:hypothetical protein